MRVAAIAVVMVGLVLTSCGTSDERTEVAGEPQRPLAIFLDGVQRWRTENAEFHGEPTYRGDGFAGWRLYGWIVPNEARPRVTSIEVVSADGTRLKIARPDDRFRGREPVLSIDPDGSLRFTMAPSGDASGAEPGTQVPRAAPTIAADRLTLARVVELRLAQTQPPRDAKQANEEATQAAFTLVIGNTTERMTPESLRAIMTPIDTGGRQGERWPLRDVLAAKSDRKVVSVTVTGRRTLSIARAALDGDPAPYLRLNKRGFFKLEGDTVGAVPDIVRIDVALE